MPDIPEVIRRRMTEDDLRARFEATIKQRVSAVLRRSPEKPVLVWGDRAVPYGQVVELMAALQSAR